MLKRCLLAICIGCMIFQFSCDKKSKPSSKKAQDTEGVLVLRLSGEPTYLNPILYTDAYSGEVVGKVFSGLFRVNETLELEPDLVETYSISDDKKTYTFTLKKDVLWQDGTPLTAKDVKFTFDKILDPTTNTVRRSNFILDGQPIQFKILDTHRFQAILPKPYAPFLTRVSMEILPEHILGKQDINTTSFNQNPVGSGPFIFKTWKTGQYIELVRNDTYHGKKPKLKGILYKILPDTNTAKIALEKGEIDMTGIQPKDYDKMKKNAMVNLFEYDDLHYSYMAFNLKNPLFQDLRLRKAIAHAINKEALIKGVLKGFGRPAELPSSPVSWAYPEKGKVYRLPYMPERSKILLKELGYQKGSGKFLEKEGEVLEITLITSKGSKVGEKTAQIVQRFLEEVGIQLKIQLMEWKSFLKVINSKEDPKPFEMVMLSWSLGIDPDAYSIWHSSQYPNGFNFIGYKNDRVDTLLVNGREEVEKEERKVIYNELFNTIAKDIPYIFLTHSKSLAAINTRVHGLSKPGPAGLLNRIEEVYIVK